MKRVHLSALLAVALMASAAHAAPNLAVVSHSPSGCTSGQPVRTGACSSVYATPKAGDLVRVNPVGNFADWDTDNFKWLEWTQVQPGAKYEAGAQDVPEDTSTSSPLVTAWPWVAKAAVTPPPPPVPVACGTINFTWTLPASMSDGSPLVGLTGFKLYQGTTPASLAALATSFTAASNSYALTGVPGGTWVYAIAAVAAGGEGAKSPVVTAVVACPQTSKIPGVPGTFNASVSLTIP